MIKLYSFWGRVDMRPSWLGDGPSCLGSELSMGGLDLGTTWFGTKRLSPIFKAILISNTRYQKVA